jgi:phospholipid-translocating P-type ATPase (flippase)
LTILWQNFVTTFNLFTYLVPMSMFFTIEISRIAWAKKIAFDPEFRLLKPVNNVEPEESDDEDEESTFWQSWFKPQKGKPDKYIYSQVRTKGVLEELGRVEYVFTDKTGTLTQNKMDLRVCFIDGVEAWNTHLPAFNKHEHKFDGSVKATLEDVVRQALMDERNVPDSEDKKKLFFYNLLVCNEVLVFGDPTKADALSPDEIAFVHALAGNGVSLIRSDDTTKVIDIEGDYQMTFKIHALLKFSADRKRMTVICESPEGQIFVLSKGADSVLKTMLRADQDWNKVGEFIDRFAKEGNRTLVMVGNSLSREVLDSWLVKYRDATTALENRERQVEAVFAELEKDLQLLGCTSVEDQLQMGVPQAVDQLLDARIKVIVLTGDKQETAVSVGKSSHIIPEGAEIITISAESKRQTEYLLLKASKRAKHGAIVVLVISGDAFAFALRECAGLLGDALSRSKSVICNRATPAQKAGFVELVMDEMQKICVAVGDGANDVSMIQKANVGIGLLGKEGSQAAQASDVVIHQFRFLSRLILIHGRYSYARSCKLVYWSFFKNLIWSTPMFLYEFWSSYSSQPFFDPLTLTGFNSWYTFLPPLIMAITEQDIPEKLLTTVPQAYYHFRKTARFSIVKFMKWNFFGLVIGLSKSPLISQFLLTF